LRLAIGRVDEYSGNLGICCFNKRTIDSTGFARIPVVGPEVTGQIVVFEKIRYRLLLSYLAVLTIILAAFAIAVRIAFASSLRQELAERLAVFAEVASSELDLEGEELAVDGQDLLLNANQAVQWFDLQGRLDRQVSSVRI
jgi:hypothetical protein